MVTMLPEIIAALVGFLALVCELIHLKRIRRVRNLAFGRRGQPAAWTWLVPVVRAISLAVAAWGFASLWLVVEAQVHNQDVIEDHEFKHLVLVVDVSPSMHLKDSGPEGNRTRRQRASDILESLFNRIPMQRYRITVIAVYTDAKMLLEDSQDHEVVRHIMETMPMWHAYKPGKTKLMTGIEQAAKVAKDWNPGSAYVVLLTDGDTVPASGMPKLPASVREFLVVGVGDPNSGSFIDGHQSRQDVNTLRQIANRLRGTYHNGNRKHLTSDMAGSFASLDEESQDRPWTRREWSLLAALVGAGVFAMIPLLLHFFGTGFVAGVPDGAKNG